MTIWTPTLEDEHKTKYRAIAAALENDIANGTLQPGQRLPTQRELSRRLSVTIGTIGRAYALAEKRGLVSLETGRGSFVRSVGHSDNTGSAQGTIDLGLNLPPPTEHSDLFSKTLTQISNFRDLPQLFEMTSFDRHRQAAVDWLGNRISCSAENVAICSGNQGALISSLATLTQPGDSVLVEELTFPGMIAAAELLHLKLLPVAMDNRGIIPDKLERAAQKAKVLYCVPTNQSPTTATMPKGSRQEIARIAAKKKLHVIEDDVYGMLIEQAPDPIASFAPQQTIMISSLAKSLSVGLRLALVLTPDHLCETMKRKMRAAQFFPAPLLCEVMARWVQDGTAKRLLAEKREVARRRQAIAAEVLSDSRFPRDSKGNHIWLTLPDFWSAEAFERAAGENGVSVFSSAAFAVTPEDAPNAVRIALGASRNEGELRTGLNVVARLLAERTSESMARY